MTPLRDDDGGQMHGPSETSAETLARMGVDTEAWAREFARTWRQLRADGRSETELLDPAAGDWLFGWFANAIAAGMSAGTVRGMREAAARMLELELRTLFEQLVGFGGRLHPDFAAEIAHETVVRMESHGPFGQAERDAQRAMVSQPDDERIDPPSPSGPVYGAIQ